MQIGSELRVAYISNEHIDVLAVTIARLAALSDAHAWGHAARMCNSRRKLRSVILYVGCVLLCAKSMCGFIKASEKVGWIWLSILWEVIPYDVGDVGDNNNRWYKHRWRQRQNGVASAVAGNRFGIAHANSSRMPNQWMKFSVDEFQLNSTMKNHWFL